MRPGVFLSLAAREAGALNHRWLGSEHFLLALLASEAEGTPAYEAMRTCSVEYDGVCAELVRTQEAQGRPLEKAEWGGVLTNAEAHQVTAFASGLALGLGAEEVQSEHERRCESAVGAPSPPPAWRQMCRGERVVVPIEQTQALISELPRLLPGEATFSFNHDGEKEAWFQATGGSTFRPRSNLLSPGSGARSVCPCCGYIALNVDMPLGERI
jgi:hypothetical protein